MDLAVIVLAAAEAAGQAAEQAEELKSEAPFFIAGGILATFAVVISVVGIKLPDFPGTATAARGVMALCAVLVVATMAATLYVSG